MTSESQGQVRTPRTPDEMAALLRERPSGWEYLAYAGELLARREAMEGQYRDDVLQYAAPSGEAIDESAAIERLKQAFPDVEALTGSLMRMFESGAHERAFGAPGEPGDPALIQHLAQRTMDTYGQFMEWARSLRSARVPSELRTAFDLAAGLVRQPVEEIRAFVDHAVATMDTVHARLASHTDSGSPVEITLDLVLTVDSDAIESFTAELDTLREAGF